MAKSPSQAVKGLEADVRQAQRAVDIRTLNAKQRDVLANLTQVLVDARIYSQSYELSETREERIKNAKTARKWLARAHKNILTASEFNVFGAVDVAQLTAEIDQVRESLK